jgi:hypothetical protein
MHMPADDDGLLTREELRERVGTTEPTLSLALNALKLYPVTLASDRRQKRYRPEWVAQVKKWLADTYGAF